MEGRVILAPNYPEINEALIFLAGPIKGATLWHNKAIKIIQDADPEMHVASPSLLVDPIYKKQNPVGFKHSSNQEEWEQVDWETYHLDLAAKTGAILFWFDKEEKHYCERGFAQTSRFEFGEWKERHLRDGARLALGIYWGNENERGFPGKYYLKYRLSQDCPNMKVNLTLEDTCKQAVELAIGV